LVEGGKYERSCQLLVKTAKMIEEVDQKLSEELYEKVVDMCNTDGDMNDYASIAEDGLVKFNNFLFKADKYSKIIQNEYLLIKTYIARKQPHNIHKACFSIIALHLSKQEWVSAIDAHENFFEYDGYGSSKYGNAASLLLDAYEKNDEKALEEAKKDNCIKYLENCLSKITKNLKLYTVSGEKKIKKKKLKKQINC